MCKAPYSLYDDWSPKCEVCHRLQREYVDPKVYIVCECKPVNKRKKRSTK